MEPKFFQSHRIKSREPIRKLVLSAIIVIGLLGLTGCLPAMINENKALKTQIVALQTEGANIRTAQAADAHNLAETATVIANPTVYAELLSQIDPEIRGATVQMGIEDVSVVDLCTSEVLAEEELKVTLNSQLKTLFHYTMVTADHCKTATAINMSGFIKTAEDLQSGNTSFSSTSYSNWDQLETIDDGTPIDAAIVNVVTQSEIPGVQALPVEAQKCTNINLDDPVYFYGFPTIATASGINIPNVTTSMQLTGIDKNLTFENPSGVGNPNHGQSGGGVWIETSNKGYKGFTLCGIYIESFGGNIFTAVNLSNVDIAAAVQKAAVDIRNQLAPLLRP